MSQDESPVSSLSFRKSTWFPLKTTMALTEVLLYKIINLSRQNCHCIKLIEANIKSVYFCKCTGAFKIHESMVHRSLGSTAIPVQPLFLGLNFISLCSSTFSNYADSTGRILLFSAKFLNWSHQNREKQLSYCSPTFQLGIK